MFVLASRAAIEAGAEQAGSTVPPTVEPVPTTEEHPTFNRTNKYTSAFQTLIDNYGVNTYREVSGSVFTGIYFIISHLNQ